MAILLFQSDNVIVFGCLKIARDTDAASIPLKVCPWASILFISFIVHCQILKVALGLSMQNFPLQVLTLDQEQKAKSYALDSWNNWVDNENEQIHREFKVWNGVKVCKSKLDRA
jgi:hypothetical protein